LTFWDTSAFVALAAAEPNSAWCREQFERSTVYVSPTLPVESASAIARLERMRILTGPEAADTKLVLAALWDRANILPYVRELSELAVELLFAHGLKAGDSIQIASWLHLQRSSEALVPFISFDERLNQAVISEGGILLLPSEPPYGEP